MIDVLSCEHDNKSTTQDEFLKQFKIYDEIIWISKSWENIGIDCIKIV